MKKIPLGRSGLTVSEYCLGTMTWGTQNTEAEGHEQMSYALEHGVTFWDTAEMYPVNPALVETAGRTEEIIGTWFAANGGRDKVVLATKIAGEGGLQERAWSPWALEHHLGASLEGLAAVLDPMDPSHAVLEVS